MRVTRPSWHRHVSKLISLVVLLGVSWPAATATAGEYIVRPCDQGRADPTTQMLRAWNDTTVDHCKSQGTYGIQFTGGKLDTAGQGMDFFVPDSAPNTSILGMKTTMVISAAYSQTAAGGQLMYADPNQPNAAQLLSGTTGGGTVWALFAGYQTPQFGPWEMSADVDTNARLHRLAGNCGSPCTLVALSDGSNVMLSNIRLRLYEATLPTLTGFDTTTGLLTAGAKTGIQDLVVTAHDADSGVASVTPAGGTAANASCANAAAAACPNDGTFTVKVDTAKLSPGPQKLAIGIRDAAGNVLTVSTPIFTVGMQPVTATTPVTAVSPPTVPPGPPNGTPAGKVTFARGKRGAGASYTKHVGTKQTITGQLLAGGKPLPGVAVDVVERLDGSTAPVTLATVTTDAKGKYTYDVIVKGSGTVTLAYPQHLGSGDYSASKVVTIRTRASISLRAGTRSTHHGSSVTFKGQLKLSPMPSDLPRVVMLVKSAYGWQSVDFVHVDAQGRFTWSHKFRSAGSYAFKAGFLSQDDVHAAVARSRAVSVHVS